MPVSDTIDWAKVESTLAAKKARALAAVGAYAARRAHEYSPKDTHFLDRSIAIEPTGDPDVIRLVCTAYYAPFVEFGHLTTAGDFVPPNPFFRNAVADTAAAFGSIVADVAINSSTFRHPAYPDDPNQSFTGLPLS